MQKIIEPTQVQQIGIELAIAWNDGSESYIPLEVLRQACPCAACAGEPDVTGYVVKPVVKLSPESFQLKPWQLIGGYAIQPTWGDGHHSGLFSFAFLRHLSAVP